MIDIFLRREIENEQCVDTGVFCLAMKLLGAALKNRIEIAVENDWNLRFAADLADAINNAPATDSYLGSLLRKQSNFAEARQKCGI